MISKENFGDLLEPGFRKIFWDQYKKKESAIPRLFDKITEKEKYFVKDSSVGAVPAFKKHDGALNFTDFAQGYNVQCEFEEYSQGIQITRQLFDDQLYGTIKKQPQGLGLAAKRKRETDGSALFNDIDSVIPSYMTVNGDGVTLANAAHPSLGGGASQSNLGSSSASHDAMIATRKLMIAYKDDIGEPIDVEPDTILCGRALEDVFDVIINSPLKSGTANNDKNFNRDKWNLIVWDKIDDNSWGMIDSQYMKMMLKWVDRIPLEFFQDTVFSTMVAQFAGYMRYGYYWNDWRFIYWHKVA